MNILFILLSTILLYNIMYSFQNGHRASPPPSMTTNHSNVFNFRGMLGKTRTF